ncbi:unnamed protein product [Didymodactylos carnosus]|uniref:Uncharacterized protein n=1 Tax=Didymodactylos carnosus TaxID=1234261 RepID=A0A814QRU4_9BILA|nr:unnamed protein product [Didymodactylos carnosus]CAF1122008.1 unnamed protein product [Didymodactylos carnosus]CAF3712294.1 unnamed protein product [Didymodactylos carnosus]CAF3885516.1 unnamed protein product [Didymodactylos carnosus]
MSNTNNCVTLPVYRQCARWLSECDVLPEALAILNSPSATIDDLANELSNGIVLCNLLNFLQPGCVQHTDVSFRPQRSRVVETLSKLSNTDAAKRKKLTPFPITGPFNYVNIPKEKSLDDAVPVQISSVVSSPLNNVIHQQEQLMCHFCRNSPTTIQSKFTSPIDSSIACSSLNSTLPISNCQLLSPIVACAASALASARKSCSPSHRLSTSSLPYTITNDCGVYGSHVSIQEDVYEALCAQPKRSINITSCQDNQRAFLPRDHAVKELLDTEANYRDSLNAIVTNFIQPLSLSSDEKKKIFLNIEAKYCSELPDAQEYLDRKIKTEPQFSQKLEQCRQKSGDLGKFQLRDTVVLPFQRIVKYSLLLHTMKKNVPPTDPSCEMKRQLLEKAENLMTDVNQYINEAKRAHDNLKVIRNIEKTICDIQLPSERSLRNYGRFISDEQFQVYDNGHRSGTRTVFLFDRVLLICKVKGSEKYTFRAALFIHGCQIEELRATKREFPFILRDTQQKRDYKFVAKTEDKRTDWLKHLRGAIGLFYQGYECSSCRKKVHRECIKKVTHCSLRASLERIRSFDRGSIELPKAFSIGSNIHQNRVYALFDYDGASNGNKFNFNRQTEHFINVVEGDELEVLEDDDEILWKVKNVRSNEIGLVPATLIGVCMLDGEPQKNIQPPSVCDYDTWHIVQSYNSSSTSSSSNNNKNNNMTNSLPNSPNISVVRSKSISSQCSYDGGKKQQLIMFSAFDKTNRNHHQQSSDCGTLIGADYVQTDNAEW